MRQYFEYLNYSLRDLLHFKPQTYYRLFELYNAEIFPAQLAAFALGLAILWLLWRPSPWNGKAIAAILAVFWLWLAWFFHHRRYATINLGGELMAAGFALQAMLLAVAAWRARLSFGLFWPGVALFLFALLAYPMIGPLLLGRPWAQVELFGVAPDPTVIGTLGLLLLIQGRARWELMVLPLIWCANTGATLWAMKSPDWFVLPLVGAIVLGLTLYRGVISNSRASSS